MDRVVLDTNVFVSGTATVGTPPSQIIEAWRNRSIVLVTSPHILAEVKEVLLREEIMRYTGLSAKEVYELISEIEKRAYVTQGLYEVWKIKCDPDDNIILACAIEGYVTHIVTGDTKSLLPLKEYHGIRILIPSDYVRAYLRQG